ncbi:MAG: hypothetical protein H6622_16990 [Halobacteriovoraceae bacterium]|nr:hypothetical protein [Halobacteriovoraceae bacterium]
MRNVVLLMLLISTATHADHYLENHDTGMVTLVDKIKDGHPDGFNCTTQNRTRVKKTGKIKNKMWFQVKVLNGNCKGKIAWAHYLTLREKLK